ncbi:MAG: hypothetical protein AAF363_01425 [Bacteroidota bacterium]
MDKLGSLFLLLILCSCANYKPHFTNQQTSEGSDGNLEHSFIFVSGLHNPKDNISVLKRQLSQSEDKTTFVLLGDNTPKGGLVDSAKIKKRVELEKQLKDSYGFIKEFNGNTVVLPGSNEWDGGSLIGKKRLEHYEEFIENFLGDGNEKLNVFLPNGGCPGPVELPINDDIVMIIIDTQRWFNQQRISREEQSCDISSGNDFLIALNDVIKKNFDKKIIVAGYHPLFSNGPSNGYYPLKTHFLPPVLGSLYVLYNKWIGGISDVSNPSFKIFSDALTNVFKVHENVVYVSSREKSFQYFENEDDHYVISGSLESASPTASGNGATAAYGIIGFSKVNYYKNGDVWLELWETSKEEPIYKTRLYNKKLLEDAEKERIIQDLDYSGQTADAFATKKHQRDKKKPGLPGNNYRKEWETVISDVPVLDLGKEKGGLVIEKKGGGQQTISLRLEETENEYDYSLRSVEKFPQYAIPVALRETVAADVIVDQISANHPYGVLGLKEMSEAAGVYHTNAKLFYLPDDPRLGQYRDDFKNKLYLFEDRPDDNRKDFDNFGNSKEIISTLDLIEKLQKNGKHSVDQYQLVKSRIFDILIGDWDRHDDQWRWAKFETDTDYDKGHNLYKPIPRDRDEAFFKGDGALIGLISHKWGQPKFQGFWHKLRDVEGLQFNARYFDRTFTTEADWSVWEKATKELQEKLTDEVIENSLKGMPSEIYEISGPEILAKLKTRRSDLLTYARQFYLFLSEKVDVVGTKKDDLFLVERVNDGETKVEVYRMGKNENDIKRKVFERTFNTDETKEVRLYGLGDNDVFKIKGDVSKGIKVRVIGGSGEDIIEDGSSVSGLSKATVIYDNKTGTTITNSGEAKIKISDKDEQVNEYDRYAFKYDVLAPNFYSGFNPDDGVFIGGGVTFTQHGFRKDPFKVRHTIQANIAPRSASYNIRYKNELLSLIGKWDLLSEVNIFQPSFGDFFYGFGNGTVFDEDSQDEDNQFYRVRYSQYILQSSLRRRWFRDRVNLEIGAYWRNLEVEEDDNEDSSEPPRFISGYSDLRSSQGFTLFDEARNFVGGYLKFGVDTRDNPARPTRGMNFNIGARYSDQVGDEDSLQYWQFNSDLSIYLTLDRARRITIASRIGGVINSGEFEFFQAARLGGLNTLRGYRRARFAGQQAVYQNNELRLKLFDLKTRLFTGPLGISGIADFGRVWAPNDLPDRQEQQRWHQAYGGGFWVSPFQALTISFDYTVSAIDSNDRGIYFRFGFMY